MHFKKHEIDEALNLLSAKYNDGGVCNNRVFCGNKNDRIVIGNNEYLNKSLKNTIIRHAEITNGKFINNAFNGSVFETVNINGSDFTGNCFACCRFSKIEYDNKLQTIAGNDFSLSNFVDCKFNNARFETCTTMQSLFYRCFLENIEYRSCTLEGTRFYESVLTNVEIGNTNIEYVTIEKCQLNNVIFPLYQFAYVIGACELMSGDALIFFRDGEKCIDKNEYLRLIDSLFLFYYSHQQYFPMSNLYCLTQDYDKAVECVKLGINKSLITKDFRMIKHYCKLAKYCNIMNFDLVSYINNAIDNFLIQEKFDESEKNIYLLYAGEIKDILVKANNKEKTLVIEIQTNIDKNDIKGKDFINRLTDEINEYISDNQTEKDGYTVSVSSHSPLLLTCTVLGAISSIVTISGGIYKIVKFFCEKYSDKKRLKHKFCLKKALDADELIRVDVEERKKTLNNRVKECMDDMKLFMRSKMSDKSKLNYIETITQRIIGSVDNMLESDLLLFKIKSEQ